MAFPPRNVNSSNPTGDSGFNAVTKKVFGGVAQDTQKPAPKKGKSKTRKSGQFTYNTATNSFQRTQPQQTMPGAC